MLARTGTYAVKTRIIDDDGAKWLDDFEWSEYELCLSCCRWSRADMTGFKLDKDW